MTIEERRLVFRQKLIDVTEIKYLYFQPPEKQEMVIPCIVYEIHGVPTLKADNGIYKSELKFRVTIISDDPTSDYVDKMIGFSRSVFVKRYKLNGYYHDVFDVAF